MWKKLFKKEHGASFTYKLRKKTFLILNFENGMYEIKCKENFFVAHFFFSNFFTDASALLTI